MCRYIAIVTDGLDGHKVIAANHEYGKVCDIAEEYVTGEGQSVEIFERVSTARPTTAVNWEGKRRPALAGS
jgi:hypothetical protein